MLSKLLRPGLRISSLQLSQRKKAFPQLILTRKSGDILPPSQYNIPLPKNFQLSYVCKEHWEIIPLIITTLAAFTVLFSAIVWACNNKVDVVFRTHSRDSISRTMDLRNPSVHKIITINQRYEPWPEMQAVLDKMKFAEKRALLRLQTCKQE